MKRLRIVAVSFVAIIAVLSATSVYLVLDTFTDRLATAEHAARENRTRLDDQQVTSKVLADQLRALGEEPVIEPADPPPSVQTIPIPGRPGTPGRDGVNGKPGRDGKAGQDGSDGTPGTPGNAGPKGDTGAAGPQGDRGQEGPVGPQGPPGTAQPGTYTCPDGEYLRGFTIAPDGAVNLICAPVAQLPTGGNP